MALRNYFLKVEAEIGIFNCDNHKADKRKKMKHEKNKAIDFDGKKRKCQKNIDKMNKLDKLVVCPRPGHAAKYLAEYD